MKRFIALLLLLVLALPLTACDSADGVVLTGEEIIEAYESAGYTVEYSLNSFISGGECTLYIYESKEGSEKNDYICIEIFENEEYARAYNEQMRFNIATWLVFAISGEPRWLHTERYGNVCVEYYPNEFIEPLKQLIKSK